LTSLFREEGEVMNELIFMVEEAPEGGYTARALGESIFTEAESMADLAKKIREAVTCHFEGSARPKTVRLHYVKDQVFAI
jgi:hypothetical protein